LTNPTSVDSQDSTSADQQNQEQLHQERLKILASQLKESKNKVFLGSLINFLVSSLIVFGLLYLMFFLFGAVESNTIGLTKVGSGFIIGLLLSLLTYINNIKFTNMNLDAQNMYERGNTQIAGQLGSIQETLKLLPEMRADLKAIPAMQETLKAIPAIQETLKAIPAMQETLKAIPEMRADLKSIEKRLGVIEGKVNP
jgi:ABC-type multidrug transport system fused ATPase/permease subunit